MLDSWTSHEKHGRCADLTASIGPQPSAPDGTWQSALEPQLQRSLALEQPGERTGALGHAPPAPTRALPPGKWRHASVGHLHQLHPTTLEFKILQVTRIT